MARVWIPADRFLSLLEQAGVTNADLEETGIRRVYELRTGRQECLSLEAADRILTKAGLSYLFRIRKEDGGLLDIYTGEDPYVPSWVQKKKSLLVPGGKQRKYATPEEAHEAHRQMNLRYARRLNKRCACGVSITNRATRCRSCYGKSLRKTVSDEEKRAAAKRRYHKSSRRHGRHCECGVAITNNATSCWACFQAKRSKPQHGTNSMYASGCRCIPCRAASARYHRERRREMMAAYRQVRAA